MTASAREPVYELPEEPRIVRQREIAPWWARLVIAGTLGLASLIAFSAAGYFLLGSLTAAAALVPAAIGGAAALAADLDRPRPRSAYVGLSALAAFLLFWFSAFTLSLMTFFVPFLAAFGFFLLRSNMDEHPEPFAAAGRGLLRASGTGLVTIVLARIALGELSWPPPMQLVLGVVSLLTSAITFGLHAAAHPPPPLEAIKVDGVVTLIDARRGSYLRAEREHRRRVVARGGATCAPAQGAGTAPAPPGTSPRAREEEAPAPEAPRPPAASGGSA